MEKKSLIYNFIILCILYSQVYADGDNSKPSAPNKSKNIESKNYTIGKPTQNVKPINGVNQSTINESMGSDSIDLLVGVCPLLVLNKLTSIRSFDMKNARYIKCLILVGC